VSERIEGRALISSTPTGMLWARAGARCRPGPSPFRPVRAARAHPASRPMHRRTLLKTGLTAGSALAAGLPLHAQEAARAERPSAPPGGRFGLKYAPHFGMFRHHAGEDRVDQLKFMHDEGFVALEDNGMPNREPALQERIATAMDDLGMEMGVFVAHADFRNPTFVDRTDASRARIEGDMRRAVEVARRVDARWCTVVPGAYRNNVEWDYQTANVIDNLRMAADICAEAELVMVLEPLNEWTNHPGVFLSRMPQAFMVCRAVDSPYCKILDDLYHQQITEGNLIPNLERSWSEIAYLQVGDNPGRKEPGTGEIHYRNVFRWLKGRGYDGIVGMEHGNSKGGKEGERAVIDAYVVADA